MVRKSLSDVLHNGQHASLSQAWDNTAPAQEFSPIPGGEYVCHVTAGELITSRSNSTPGYKVEFTILDGEHARRKLWHTCWLTDAAISRTKRDLQKLGVTSLDQLNQPMPKGIRCAVKVVVRRSDTGADFNEIRNFTVVGIDTPAANPFAPGPPTSPDQPPETPVTPIGDAAEPAGEADTSFDPNAFRPEVPT